MIRIKRKRKNPNLKGEETIDITFIRLLRIAWMNLKDKKLEKARHYISSALIYANIGLDKCDDCGENCKKCECDKCDDCNCNKCMCNLKTIEEAQDFILMLTKKYKIQNEFAHRGLLTRMESR